MREGGALSVRISPRADSLHVIALNEDIIVVFASSLSKH